MDFVYRCLGLCTGHGLPHWKPTENFWHALFSVRAPQVNLKILTECFRIPFIKLKCKFFPCRLWQAIWGQAINFQYFTNSFWVNKDKAFIVSSICLRYHCESNDVGYDHTRSCGGNVVTWGQLDLWTWSSMVKSCIIRFALTWELQWCSYNGRIMFGLEAICK